METCLSICAPPSGQGLAPEFRPQKTPWPGSSWLEEVVIHDKPTHGASALGASMRDEVSIGTMESEANEAFE